MSASREFQVDGAATEKNAMGQFGVYARNDQQTDQTGVEENMDKENVNKINIIVVCGILSPCYDETG